MWRREKRKNTHLDETVGRVAIPEVCNSKRLAPRDLAYLHGEEGDGPLFCAEVAGVDLCGVCVDSDLGGGGRQEVEDVAEGNAEGEEVPKLCDGVCGLPRVGGGGKLEKSG